MKDGFVVGLGSGNTVAHAIAELGRRVRVEGLQVSTVPTSYQVFFAAIKEGLKVTSLDAHPQLDLAIDGADEIDGKLNLVKGGGAALAREKMVAFSAKRYVIIADETKLVKKLGSTHPLPVEILPFAASVTLERIKKLWKKAEIREGGGKVGPLITDNGNFIVDVHCGPLKDPEKADGMLKAIPGVVETGLFLKLADVAYVGDREGRVRKLA